MTTTIRVAEFDGDLSREFMSLIDAAQAPDADDSLYPWKHDTWTLWREPGQKLAGHLRPDASGNAFEVWTSAGEKKLSSSERGALIGRFIEMVISHFDGRYSNIIVTLR